MIPKLRQPKYIVLYTNKYDALKSVCFSEKHMREVVSSVRKWSNHVQVYKVVLRNYVNIRQNQLR